MSTEGSTKAILAALGANVGIAVAKFVGFAITGSSSMLAEGVHSVADSGNQGLLLLGGKQAKRQADAKHQFGYGANRYFFAFVVALVLFLLGSVFAIYEAIHKLQHPEPLSMPIVAVLILVVAIGLEGYSFRTAMRESSKLRGDSSWWQFIRNSRNPELPVVLLEDSGALVGLVFALFGVSMTWATDNPVFDAIGTLLIGILLGIIAIILITETRSLLIGEPAVPAEQARIEQLLVESGSDRVITRVVHLRTQHLSPDDLLIAAKVAVAPGSTIQQISVAINDAEARVRAGLPHSALIYLEPDLLNAVPAPEAATRGQIGSP
ncbi:cation diffusion facilitator family transporter [Antricoccus suffuscus]|uniref:Cation diffusion facilitator family transporter n=1 Tax=Antricoccus suffuscus TaxID=1629062 RepID=A0A2T0ZQN3_9ACTN|nr:cation diffusion facilitator family transporter [Antricoccus suffuscus]PRZ38594.1 cation diffusion facilitator family transporter [Antricoccus suffuscus]